jgi:hypothetical protein
MAALLRGCRLLGSTQCLCTTISRSSSSSSTLPQALPTLQQARQQQQ